MMKKQLYDVNEGESFGLFLLIKSANVRVAKNGNPFIALTFQDQSGSMDGMYWTATPEEIAKFQAGQVVYVRGERTNYNGQSQIRISQLRIAEEGEPNDPTFYMERISNKRSDLQEELDEALYLIKDPNIARVVRKILHDVEEKFYQFPAAKRHHHALAGGLSLHTISMIRIAKALLSLYPQLNASLLIGGIVLHDIGKTVELTGPLSTEYTLKGNLIGHIVIMDEMIERVCSEIGISSDSESILLLKHCILAHHGKLEYGSPVTPRVMEAEIIHQIDLMDATLNMMTNALEKTDSGEFTEAIYAMDRRTFYKPNLN